MAGAQGGSGGLGRRWVAGTGAEAMGLWVAEAVGATSRRSSGALGLGVAVAGWGGGRTGKANAGRRPAQRGPTRGGREACNTSGV